MGLRQGASVLATAAVIGTIALAGCGGDDDDDGGGGGGGGGGDLTAFCDKIEELQGQADPFAGVSPNDVEGAQDAVNEYVGSVGEIADVAPAEVRDDVVEVQGAFEDLAAALGQAETPQQLTEAAQTFQREAAGIQEAVDRLQSYTEENCEQ
jgi:hypothetical protein